MTSKFERTYEWHLKELHDKAPDLEQEVLAGRMHPEVACAKLRRRERQPELDRKYDNDPANDRAVKKFLDAMRAYRVALEAVIDARGRGEFAPEVLRSIRRKHETIRKLMKTLEGGKP